MVLRTVAGPVGSASIGGASSDPMRHGYGECTMAAPEHVPTRTLQQVRSYSSPPRRAGSWTADRPGELRGRQPVGEQLGTPGPDQGYALTLAERFSGRLTLSEGEHEADALAGAAGIAMKRSALFGRAPVIHDMTVALTIWGYLDATAAPELIELRREWFEEVHLPMHYTALQRIVDAAPEPVLRLTHQRVIERYRDDWRACLDLDRD